MLSSQFFTTCAEFCVAHLMRDTFSDVGKFHGRPAVFKIELLLICVCLCVFACFFPLCSSIQRDRQRAGGGGVRGAEAVQGSAGFPQRRSRL